MRGVRLRAGRNIFHDPLLLAPRNPYILFVVREIRARLAVERAEVSQRETENRFVVAVRCNIEIIRLLEIILVDV